ncbi:MAG TPA: hypothetical protein DEP72_00180 [Clostridiales bacterium]|nr:MAG: hypothetical protein A2Y18_08280 [Clostridiales bacterium GWD2_32_19]HCC06569.1 hypothetical protein [Clostridiales bacterium]
MINTSRKELDEYKERLTELGMKKGNEKEIEKLKLDIKALEADIKKESIGTIRQYMDKKAGRQVSLPNETLRKNQELDKVKLAQLIKELVEQAIMEQEIRKEEIEKQRIKNKKARSLWSRTKVAIGNFFGEKEEDINKPIIGKKSTGSKNKRPFKKAIATIVAGAVLLGTLAIGGLYAYTKGPKTPHDSITPPTPMGDKVDQTKDTSESLIKAADKTVESKITNDLTEDVPSGAKNSGTKTVVPEVKNASPAVVYVHTITSPAVASPVVVEVTPIIEAPVVTEAGGVFDEQLAKLRTIVDDLRKKVRDKSAEVEVADEDVKAKESKSKRLAGEAKKAENVYNDLKKIANQSLRPYEDDVKDLNKKLGQAKVELENARKAIPELEKNMSQARIDSEQAVIAAGNAEEKVDQAAVEFNEATRLENIAAANATKEAEDVKNAQESEKAREMSEAEIAAAEADKAVTQTNNKREALEAAQVVAKNANNEKIAKAEELEKAQNDLDNAKSELQEKPAEVEKIEAKLDDAEILLENKSNEVKNAKNDLDDAKDEKDEKLEEAEKAIEAAYDANNNRNNKVEQANDAVNQLKSAERDYQDMVNLQSAEQSNENVL